MNNRVKLLIALLIGLCPVQQFKRILYQVIFGYTIHPTARIGLVLINVERMVLHAGARIEHFNLITNFQLLELLAGAEIKMGNVITVPRVMGGRTRLWLGPQATITRRHFFDLTGNVIIGENTVIGGLGSQFWTHSFDTDRNIRISDIHIGDHCFIGSAVRFSPGSKLPDRVVVGMGSVVTGCFEQGNALIAGVPARVIRSLDTAIATSDS